MEPVRIDVATPSRAYAVTIGEDGIDRLKTLLTAAKVPERRFVVSNSLVWRFHGARFARALPGTEVVMVPDGERFKLLQTVSRVYEALIRANADRASTVITFGGTCRRRCWRRWTAQSAARSASTTCSART
jgi:3-dehydroquinate synthase